jgi:hypothetical protein
MKDNQWLVGDGGGPNATFVRENGNINPLPGSSSNPEFDQQGDNDYYFAGDYTTTLPGVVGLYGSYTPVGSVLANEEGAERAFAGNDLELRYHFNLPPSLQPEDQLAVTFSAVNLDNTAGLSDPRCGVEVYFNGVKVQNEIVIRPPQVSDGGAGVDFTTPPFTLASVDARTGPGYDNIISLKGISYSAQGGGSWMGFDYVQLNPVTPSAFGAFPWAVGQNDDTHIRNGHGGGPNANFMQENGWINALPGSAFSPVVDRTLDNDYYLAGYYSNTIPGVVAAYGAYTPAGFVPKNEEAAERAFANTDNDLRYHFNLPDTLQPDDLLAVTFDPLDMDNTAGLSDPRYGIEVYFNGVLVRPKADIRPDGLGKPYTTTPFTLASVDARVGPGYDNIVSLKGYNYSAEGGGNWMGIDYVQLNPAPPQLLPPVVQDGQIKINWIGKGGLEKATNIVGPWEAITPAPTAPFAEPMLPNENRFYRLKN